MLHRDILKDCIEKAKSESTYEGTKVGIVAVDNYETVIGAGCNTPITVDVKNDPYMTIHAEINMINNLQRRGYEGEDIDYIAISTYPCIDCAKVLVDFGIKKVVVMGRFLTNWRSSQENGIVYMEDNNVEVIRHDQ